MLLAIAESRRAFVGHVWPLWRDVLGGEEVISVEDSDRKLESAADRSGTDAFMVRHKSGVLVPLASRVERFNPLSNNPFNQRYEAHYPRFTIRLGRKQKDGSFYQDVECRKRLAALDDPVSRRYLPLYTIQSLVKFEGSDCTVLQTSAVETDALFEYIKRSRLGELTVGTVNYTHVAGDAYRLITVERLWEAGVVVQCQPADARVSVDGLQPSPRGTAGQ